MLKDAQRIMVIGNGGGGKSTLSSQMSKALDLTWHEVDVIQFQPGWARTPEDVVRQDLLDIQNQTRWIIDGFGPWDTIESRSQVADTIVFVDFPIWVHFWWASERQIQAALGQPRFGGPKDCDLREMNKEMFKILWHVHENIRPKLLDLFGDLPNHCTLHHLQSVDAYEMFLDEVCTEMT